MLGGIVLKAAVAQRPSATSIALCPIRRTINYIDLIQAKLILAGKTLSRLQVNPFSGSVPYEQGVGQSRSKRQARVR
jgi:hypothetical protein